MAKHVLGNKKLLKWRFLFLFFTNKLPLNLNVIYIYIYIYIYIKQKIAIFPNIYFYFARLVSPYWHLQLTN